MYGYASTSSERGGECLGWKKVCGKSAERNRKREGIISSRLLEPPFIFQRYREWLPRFFTKLIECSPPLRTMRQLPVKLSSARNADAPSPAADNIKSASIWQNSRSVIALIRCTLCQPSFPIPIVLSPPRSRISLDHLFSFLLFPVALLFSLTYSVSVYWHSCRTRREHI